MRGNSPKALQNAPLEETNICVWKSSQILLSVLSYLYWGSLSTGLVRSLNFWIGWGNLKLCSVKWKDIIFVYSMNYDNRFMYLIADSHGLNFITLNWKWKQKQKDIENCFFNAFYLVTNFVHVPYTQLSTTQKMFVNLEYKITKWPK